MSHMLDAAVSYLERGWPVIPVDSRTKKALVEWKQYQTGGPSLSQVRDWWGRKYPQAGIALITGHLSGILVVDIDPRHGGDSNGLPETGMRVQTGGGGEHLYYYMPSEGFSNVANSETGRDVRAQGGYVILPPTVHESGEPYVWDPDEELGTITLAELYEHCPRAKPKPKSGEVDDTQPGNYVADAFRNGFGEGERNSGLARCAGHFARTSVPVDIALAQMCAIADKCTPPLDHQEVVNITRSIYLRELDKRKAEEEKEKSVSDAVELTPFSVYQRKHGGKSVQWLIPGFSPDRTVGFIAGPPGSYKTWIEFDLAVSIASGLPFLGIDGCKPRRTGKVLIFQQEDPHEAIAERLSTIYYGRLGLGMPRFESGILTMPESPPELNVELYEDRDVFFGDDEWKRKIEGVVRKTRPVAVFFDPMYSLVEMDDNMVKAAQTLFFLKKLRDETGTSFFFIHHTNKGSSQGMARESLFGSQFINAFLETMIQMRNVFGMPGCAILSRRTKAAGPRENVYMRFDIFDPTQEGHGGWRYSTIGRNIGEAESVRVLDNERHKRTDQDGNQLVNDTLFEDDELAVMGKISRPGGLPFDEVKREKMDLELLDRMRKCGHIKFDKDSQTFLSGLTI